MPHVSFTMPMLAAKEMARALLPHVSTDDVTPALGGVWLGGDHGQYAFASDRYSVGRFDITSYGDIPETVMWIPREALRVVSTLGKSIFWHGHEAVGKVTFETEWEARKEGARRLTSGRTLITVSEPGTGETPVDVWFRVFHAPGADSTPPPVRRLFADFMTGEGQRVESVVVSDAPLTKLATYARIYRHVVRFTMPFPGSSNRAQKPVLAEVGPRLKVLIQPYALIREDTFGAPLESPTDTPAPAEGEAKTDG